MFTGSGMSAPPESRWDLGSWSLQWGVKDSRACPRRCLWGREGMSILAYLLPRNWAWGSAVWSPVGPGAVALEDEETLRLDERRSEGLGLGSP